MEHLNQEPVISLEEGMQNINAFFKTANQQRFDQKVEYVAGLISKAKIQIEAATLKEEAAEYLLDKTLALVVKGGASPEHKHFVSAVNSYRELQDCKFLNLIVEDLQEDAEYSKDITNEAYKKAVQSFMKHIQRNLEDHEKQNSPGELVNTKGDIERKIENFIKANAPHYKRLNITLQSHGTEDGRIATHDKGLYSNNDYLKFIKKWADQCSIQVNCIMGQCYSHVHDKLSLLNDWNVSVYATTSLAQPENCLKIYFRDETLSQVDSAKDLGLQKHAENYPLKGTDQSIANEKGDAPPDVDNFQAGQAESMDTE